MKNGLSSGHIVFIHGLFMNPESWHEWKLYFEARGYTCHTPAYPFHEGDPAALRKSMPEGLGRLSFGQVLDTLVKFIDRLEEKPVLIGHSMGGLAVQRLLGMGRGLAGISIDPAPPQGIFSFKWSFLKANLATVNPLKGNSVCLPSVEWFRYAFCNHLSVEEARVEYQKYVVPESRNIPRSSTGKDGSIDFNAAHAPLLIIAGEKDHIVPATLNRKNFEAYKHKGSRTDFKMFKDRTHYICGQAQWEEVAAHIDEWIKKL